MAEAWAVIPAGGSGSRFSATEDKLLNPLAGKPVLQRTLEVLLWTPRISGIVLVASEKALECYQKLTEQAFPNASIRLALGGETRRASVYQGLLALPESAEIVVIHDAARPLMEPTMVAESIQAVEAGAVGAVIAVPVNDTLKRAEPGIETIAATVDRAHLWRAQTPQTFQKSVLLQAHQGVPLERSVTDDAQLLELAGLGPVKLLPGSERNLKITRKQDIQLAEALLAQEPSVGLC